MEEKGTNMNKDATEKLSHIMFLVSSLISIAAVVLICFFILAQAYPALRQIGFIPFLLGQSWKPIDVPPSYGIFTMIVGSLYTTAGAILCGVPIGLGAALFLAEFCPPKVRPFLNQCISLLSGIPSIIYGYFGMMVIVPFIQKHFSGNGNSLLAASIVLGMMILPTIISISEAALRAVPSHYREGALALGASREEAAWSVLFPAAASGITTSVILGISRAIGETMAVVMVAGNAPIIPNSIFKPVRTLTANIVQEMSYSEGLHTEALMATAAVLFVFILLLNILLNLLRLGKEGA